jgi:hypothetical protein
MPALPSLLYGVIVVLYYILLEGYLGQTVGKMVFRALTGQQEQHQLAVVVSTLVIAACSTL